MSTLFGDERVSPDLIILGFSVMWRESATRPKARSHPRIVEFGQFGQFESI